MIGTSLLKTFMSARTESSWMACQSQWGPLHLSRRQAPRTPESVPEMRSLGPSSSAAAPCSITARLRCIYMWIHNTRLTVMASITTRRSVGSILMMGAGPRLSNSLASLWPCPAASRIIVREYYLKHSKDCQSARV